MAHSTDGTYTVQFSSSHHMGAGVITLSDLKLTGGDSGFLFSGSFREFGHGLVGRVNVRQHLKGHPSIFGTLETFELDLKGQFDGDVGVFHGHVVQEPMLKIKIELKRADSFAAE